MATLAIVAAIVGAAPSAGQSVRLQEPDFSGLFQVESVSGAPVLRDTVRGWTYFAGGSVEGVSLPQALIRVSEAGLVDTSWRLPGDFQITNQYLAPDGTPIVQAYVKSSPTYERRWYRLTRDSVGMITPTEIATAATAAKALPPRDSLSLLTTSDGLDPRVLTLSDGSSIAFEITVVQGTPKVASYTLKKRDTDQRELWSTDIGGGLAHYLATDVRGNVYVVGDAVSIGGKTANLLRLGADGRVDTTWSPSIDISDKMTSIMRVVGDRLIIANGIGGTTPVNRLTSFDVTSGAKLSERYPPNRFLTIADDGTVLAGAAEGHWALLDGRRNDSLSDRVSSARVGTSAWLSAATPWQDGYVLGGNFLYWFDGKLYRNLMRVDAAFRPDPTWTPLIDGTVSALAVDAQGRLFVGTNSASGQEARLMRFNTSGALDDNWHPVITGDVHKIYPASDGMLFIGGAFSAIDGVERGSLARFRADGTLDRDWASQPTWPVMLPVRWGQFGRDGIYNILDAGTDGIYFIWEDGYMNGSASGVKRLSRVGNGAELPVPGGLAAAPEYSQGGGSMMRDPVTGVIYAIASSWDLTGGTARGTALIRLRPPDMTVDAAWTTFTGDYDRPFSGFAYQTEAHIYVCRSYVNSEVRRFDKTTGREDPDWRSDDILLCNAKSFVRGGDGATTVLGSSLYGPLFRYSTTLRNEPRTVVEYYSRAAKRFFMTGRANEIALLDTQSANFSRTGMQFSAETATMYSSDTTRAPICRFYAPPEAGGSNTHFYGRDSDCTMLKRFATLRYEGYDFRAGLPGNDGACPPALPQPVFRLFNQLTTSNSGNHRYVVSDARKNEMIAAGWADEGVAFCTSSVTDSRPLAEVIR